MMLSVIYVNRLVIQIIIIYIYNKLYTITSDLLMGDMIYSRDILILFVWTSKFYELIYVLS